MAITFSRAFRLLAVLLLALAFSAPLAKPVSVNANTLTVNILTDEADGSCGDVDCSLRDAMALAEANAGPDTIDFAVTGTITVSATLGCLPVLNNGQTTIDGTTAPGFAGTPLVAITAGPGLSCGITGGITIGSDDNVVRGLAIHSFSDGCIEMDGASGNVIGPDMVLSDCSAGVNMAAGSGNHVQGSYIGTDSTGMSAWGNSYAGVYLNNGAGNPGPTGNYVEDNVISGNDGSGIVLWGDATSANIITGNKIGVAADGVTPLGNYAAGIWIANGAYNNRIGGGLQNDPNIIANSATDAGVVVTDATSDGNRITRNSIYDNYYLGIDLGHDGVTCNSPSEGGPNDFLPCPVITTATKSLVAGTTCPNCIVQAFIADPDPSTYGEGRTWLGDTETTDGNFSIPGISAQACDRITATAIGQNEDYGNTSEFALNVKVPCELGDANNDGNVSMVDAMLIAQYVAGLIGPGALDLTVADANCSGAPTMVDAMLIAQKVAGLITEFPACGP
jgi:CSLREA domain-containing protein